LIDALNNANLSPVIGYGYNPVPLQSSGGQWNSPPTSLDAWGSQVANTVAAHFQQTNRYVAEHEVWNEPDLPGVFWTGNESQYFSLFNAASRGIRAGNPDAVVSGPALCCSDWQNDFLNYVNANNLPLDVFSFHYYGDPTSGGLTPYRDASNSASTGVYRWASLDDNLDEYNPVHDFSPNTVVIHYPEAAYLLNSFKSLLAMPWITHVDWAQMQDPICPTQCDVIGLLDQDGHRRAAYNAYSIYANMPVDRRQLTIGGSVDGLASADQHKASVALWNLSGSDQAVNVALNNIPFATGNFRVYRIDATHASYVDNPNSETLTPTEQYPNVQTGGLTWSGTIPSNAVVYLEVEDGSSTTQLNPVTVGKVIRVQNYDPDRTKTSYADFDPKTWIGHLGMAGNQWADQEVGVTAEQMPASLDITSQIDGTLVKNDANSCACVRVDYQVNGAYTKGVLFHGPYNGSVDLYDPARSAPMPWGTQRQPDQVVSVPNIASFPISLGQYAPSGWSGRVQLTSILQNAGNNARWKVTIRPTLPASPKAHWTFNDGSGTTASDSSGNNNPGTLYGGATWTSSSRVGSHAINFDGSNNAVVDVPNPVVDTSQSYAVAAWVKMNSTTNFQTFASIDGNNVSGFFLQYCAACGRFAFSALASDNSSATPTRAVSNAAPTIGTWYHLVGVYDAGAKSISLYVNGVLQQTVSYTTAWRAPFHTVIGRGKFNGTGTDFVNGAIDDVWMFNRVLSQQEIYALAYCLQVKVLSHMSSTRISAAQGGKGSVATYTPCFHEPFAPTYGCRFAICLMRLRNVIGVGSAQKLQKGP